VINRGNGRATIFHKAQDYQAFLSIIALAKARHPVKMFAFSLTPNYFHLLIEASRHQSQRNEEVDKKVACPLYTSSLTISSEKHFLLVDRLLEFSAMDNANFERLILRQRRRPNA
jgi:REP element-mobilizing transposase RayT